MSFTRWGPQLPPPRLKKLPREVLKNIAGAIDNEATRNNFALVCKQFRDIINEIDQDKIMLFVADYQPLDDIEIIDLQEEKEPLIFRKKKKCCC